MDNPYSIKIADFSQGMQGLTGAMAQRSQFERQKAAETKNLQMREKVSELSKTGTPEQIGDFVAKNPGASQVFQEVLGIKSKVTKEARSKAAWANLLGEQKDYAQNLIDLAEAQDAEGEDASSTIEMITKSTTEPDLIKDVSRKYLLSVGDPNIKAFIEDERKKKDLELKSKTSDIKEYEYGIKYPDFVKTQEEKRKSERGGKQKTASFLVRDPETGKLSIATGSFNTKTGKLETETAPLGNLEVVSKLGETGKEETKRKILQTEGETQTKAQVKRDDALITRGISAAESTATTRRALELLDLVKTGGFSKASYEANRLLGIESANEGELSNSLGKSVLSQLRETFGAAFTENEGNRLAKIEADFGKSPAANKRLLIQALRITTKTAERAKKAALRRGDKETAADIDDLLKFSLSDPDNPFQNIDTTQFQSLPVDTILNTPYGEAKWDGTKLIKVGE